mgnify:CR=1 FL=1
MWKLWQNLNAERASVAVGQPLVSEQLGQIDPSFRRSHS